MHANLFPVFAHSKQSFVRAVDLKAALGEMADHYDALSDDEKKLGTMTYADYPPVKMNNAVTKLFDARFPSGEMARIFPNRHGIRRGTPCF